MELIAFLMGGIFVLAGGYFAANRTVVRLHALQQEREESMASDRRQRVVSGLLGEIRDNMGLAKGEFGTGMSADPPVPAALVTGAWEQHRGEFLAFGKSRYEILRAAYGATYHANSVRDFVLYASTKSFGKASVSDHAVLHKAVVKQKVIPSLYKAIDTLEDIS